MSELTLDEAIKHCLEVAENNEQFASGKWIGSKGEANRQECLQCAADHRQLAEWFAELKETKRLLKLAVEDIEGRSADKCKGCIYENASDREKYVNCTNFHCYEWRYTDEALNLINDEK